MKQYSGHPLIHKSTEKERKKYDMFSFFMLKPNKH
uniref:Uncharacterized protein n=1 Tax=Rhizophora mucronata TaxID=61149 RepID=A0A2P2PY62_RHIMU